MCLEFTLKYIPEQNTKAVFFPQDRAVQLAVMLQLLESLGQGSTSGEGIMILLPMQQVEAHAAHMVVAAVVRVPSITQAVVAWGNL